MVLPQNAVQEHAVVVSADSLMASIHSDASQAQASLLASGGSLINSSQFLGTHPQLLTQSGSSLLDSGIVQDQSSSLQYPTSSEMVTSSGSDPSQPATRHPVSSMQLQENLEYHPIRLSTTSGAQQPSTTFEGKTYGTSMDF